jgi:hypothetical protein
VHVQVLDSGNQPGDILETAEGVVFDGANPDFAKLRLPGGAPPEEYGEPEGDGEAFRCGEVEADEAERLVQSLAAARASHVPNDVWEVFSEDLSTSYVIQVIAIVSDAEGCGIAESVGDQQPTMSPAPDEDLGHVDPCALIAPAVEGVATGEPTRGDTNLPLDGRSSACSIPVGEGYGAVDVTLRSRSTSLDEARWWVEALFGPRALELPLDGGTSWENACLVEELPCERAIALLVRDHLLVVRLQAGPGEIDVDIRALAAGMAATIASGSE